MAPWRNFVNIFRASPVSSYAIKKNSEIHPRSNSSRYLLRWCLRWSTSLDFFLMFSLPEFFTSGISHNSQLVVFLDGLSTVAPEILVGFLHKFSGISHRDFQISSFNFSNITYWDNTQSHSFGMPLSSFSQVFFQRHSWDFCNGSSRSFSQDLTLI